MDGLNLNLAGASLTQTAIIFLTVMPDPLALRRGTGDEFLDDVRAGQITAATLSIAVGLGLSLIASQWQPFIIAILASGAMIVVTNSLAQSPGKETES